MRVDNRQLTHIGTIELVSLPGEQLVDVPAKIDTGADSSSIWASSITKHDGVLSFVLFDKSSPLYTGRTITTEAYRLTLVRNSFGVAENRYKVKMPVVIGGRKILASFTLANRASNRYPILIGRKTLHGKFLVDVTRKPAEGSRSVLMLSTKRTNVTQKYADNISANDGLEVTYAAYEDLDYFMGMPGNRIMLRRSGQDIASFDMVYFKTTAKYMDVAATAARYLEKRNIAFIDRAVKHFPATSKLYQYALLENSGLRVPPSVFMLPAALGASYQTIADHIGLPFVLKDIHGKRGEHNYLVCDKASFDSACKQAAADNVQCVAQAFIPNDCDYRVLVMGSKIGLVIKRTRVNDETHLNNTSQGAGAEILPATSLPASLQKACLEGAQLLERQIAGVDILQDKNSGVWYCLEVNDGPQLASGSFTAEKHIAVVDYIRRKISVS
jgi:glutathione synthase/RimK-type ligase-like ATP-grasp enzyme